MLDVRKMNKTLPVLFALLALIGQARGDVDGYGPWKFGMSPDQVTSEKGYGPYKEVAVTGGVETFNAKWDGKKANVSFIFKDAKLDKIQIWAYEGKDQAAALSAWWRVAAYLQKTHGELEFPQFPELAPNVGKEAFTENFKAVLKEGKIPKFQMGIKEKPKGATIFSSFFTHPTHGYYVFLFYRKS